MRVSIIAPGSGSVNLSQFTHHPPISQITHHPPKSFAYHEAPGLDTSSFTSYGLAWSTATTRVSIIPPGQLTQLNLDITHRYTSHENGD